MLRTVSQASVVLAFIFCIGCSGQQGGVGIGGNGSIGGIFSGNSSSSGSSSSQSLSATAQAALSALNQSPTYQITSADISALESSGALSAAEIAELKRELGL